MKDVLRLFLPKAANITLAEKFRAGCAGGIAILGLGLLIRFIPHGQVPLLVVVSMAASTVLLFAVPHSPMAQPWNLVIGHGISALAGWCVAYLVNDVVVASAIAVGVAILFMHLLDALHPPGAATALSLVLSGTQFRAMGGAAVITIVMVNVFAMLALALLINNLLPGRRYPMPHPQPVRTPHLPPMGIMASDIQQALKDMDSVIDASEDDLLEIYERAEHHAQQRTATAPNSRG
jgi:CBS domain-containing membrane protein